MTSIVEFLLWTEYKILLRRFDTFFENRRLIVLNVNFILPFFDFASGSVSGFDGVVVLSS